MVHGRKGTTTHGLVSRRTLMQQLGFASFLLHPMLRSMALAAEPVNAMASAPRFIMFFKGGAFTPAKTNPSSIFSLAGTPLAPMQDFAEDIILFKNMSIHGGSPKSEGIHEEHGAGLFGCVTGHTVKYSGGDSYYAYTDHESIDMRISQHYASRADLKSVPISSLHIGAGAHSDSDSTGQGQRYISFKKRSAGQTRYGNAMEPVQNAAQVYEQLMTQVALKCSQKSLQPKADLSKVRAALAQKKSLIDLMKEDVKDAQRTYGLDSEHSQKLAGMLEAWSETEKLVQQQQKGIDGNQVVTASGRACPSIAKATGNGSQKYSLDALSPVHDQMIQMIRLAFEWDLTRVVAFTLSGASGGQTWPSQGIHSVRHSLEHAGNVASLVKMDTYFSQKFANLLKSLKTIDDGDGKSALFNSSIVLGMECWSTGGHSLKNIPFVFAGQGGGKFKTGRIVNAEGRSNNDLLISCQQAAGIQSKTFGLESLCRGPII